MAPALWALVALLVRVGPDDICLGVFRTGAEGTGAEGIGKQVKG